MFGDNMVLQQRTSNAVWGIAEPGEKVTLRASWGTSAETVADDDGNWKVLLETPGHGTDHELTINASNSPGRMNQDIRLSPLDQKLIQGGVGLVSTVVQVLGQSGLGDLGKQSEERFSRSLDPHDKIQYWAWPATMMRAITAAHAKTDHFEGGGKVAMSGGSGARRVDFFTNHRKTIGDRNDKYATYISSPYTRVKLQD